MEYHEKILIVTIETSIGMIKGIWNNEKKPTLVEKYFVELNIDMPIWRTELIEHLSSLASLDNENVIFVGVCEDNPFEEYYLRLDIAYNRYLDINDPRIERKRNILYDWLEYLK